MRARVLFACRANAGRSVTARILADHYAPAFVDAHSAGSEPGDHVHPEITSALADLGLDTSAEAPKPFDLRAQYDTVITMGCGDTCPSYRGARYEDWPVADPKGRQPQAVMDIIADIDGRVRTLIWCCGQPTPPLTPLDRDRISAGGCVCCYS